MNDSTETDIIDQTLDTIEDKPQASPLDPPQPKRPAIRMWTIIWGLFVTMIGVGMMISSGTNTVGGHGFFAMGTFVAGFLFLAAIALIVRAIVAATHNKRM